jgi:hypothetical protein
MALLRKETFSATTLDSKDKADTHPFRLVYADHVPVREWQVWYGQTFDDVKTKALRRSRDDLRPGSGIVCNLFIVQRWAEDQGCWDEYDEDGRELTDLAFGGEG